MGPGATPFTQIPFGPWLRRGWHSLGGHGHSTRFAAEGTIALIASLSVRRCLLGVRERKRSLLFPDIELALNSRNACPAGLSGNFGRPLADIFENHADIGYLTGRRVRI